MNPDEIEEFHHQHVHLSPPKITFACQCPIPNYWRLNSMNENIYIYRCSSLPICKTDEFCGNVSYDLGALYQSCLCPKHHICVHNGGVTHKYISELLFRGRGWKAYCRRVNTDYSYEDYWIYSLVPVNWQYLWICHAAVLKISLAIYFDWLNHIVMPPLLTVDVQILLNHSAISKNINCKSLSYHTN